jgi:putative nucleotidyltransferase with HDIG domain
MTMPDGLMTNDLLAAGRRAQEERRWDDALTAFERAYAALPESDLEVRIDVLRRIGYVHYYRGDLELAQASYSASCELARALGSSRHLASGLNGVATIQQALGQMDRAELTYREAFAAAEAAGYGRLAVMIEQNLGTMASVRGDSHEALRCYYAALKRYEAEGDNEGVMQVLNNIGMVHTKLQQWVEADRTLLRALDLARSSNDMELLGTIQLNRADLYLQQERFDDARACADQAFELFGRLGSKQGLGETYKFYGCLFRASGKLHLADAHLGVVSELAQDSEYQLLLAESLAEHALVHLDLGRNAEALRTLNRAHRVFGDLRARRELLDIEQRLDTLEGSYLHIVQAWADSIESKDIYTAGHCRRVADLTCMLAAAVGYQGRDLTWMRMGAFLHDVGKTRVDTAVLNKQGKLDDSEWLQMRNHTVEGDDIVKELDFPWDIRPIVRNHHERWDGTGYPDRLQGEEIPLAARILCVADVYDALTTERPYHRAYTQAEALQIMTAESGRQLDPSLFAIFHTLMTERPAPIAAPTTVTG